MYAIYEHLPKWPAFIIDNTRTVFKLRKDKYVEKSSLVLSVKDSKLSYYEMTVLVMVIQVSLHGYSRQ